MKSFWKSFWIILRDAVIICAAMAVAGIFINAVRPDGLPFIADKPYDIFVPCPETLGTVEMIAPGDSRLTDGKAFIVDARSQEEFDAWHLDGAICITYDYLEPIEEAELKNVTLNIVNSGKERLIVYGDGDGGQGSTGYELGRELAGKGVSHVFIVEGGADALKK
ncbi:MAG: rhodanese-like domain-containing protein [Proteobacteria bacterium]|nr:rhodanese-like domain-containing protein [Pseudomonadota bacterium]